MVDLAGIDVDGPEDEHIVGPAQESVMHRKDRTTGASLGNQLGQIPRPIADKRGSLLSAGW